MSMKIIVGIILLLVGLFLLVQGIQIVNEIDRKNSTLAGKITYRLSSNYQEKSNEQKTIGYGMAISGGILILLGLKKLFESSNSTVNTKPDVKNETALDFLFARLNSVVKQKDYKTGIALIYKIIEIEPKSKEAYFNLACLYSITEKEESFYALSKAIENGYTNIEKIKTYPDLSWLRRQPKFNEFTQNGYKLPAINDLKNIQQNQISISDETISQIERLGKLKEQGLITEDEFQTQKNKILNKHN